MMQPAVALPGSATPRLSWHRFAGRRLGHDAALAREWNRLNAASLDAPFLAASALTAALEAFGEGGERLLVGRLGDRVAAMFLLAPQGPGRWSTFQPSQVPLGAWVAEPSLHLDALAEDLLDRGLRFAVVVSVTQVDPLASPRRQDRRRTQHGDYIETGWLDVEGRFADYWAARGKNLRQNLRKQRNKLATDGIRTELRLWTAPEDMAPALARYGSLESAGWKATRGTSIHPDNAQGRFYAQLLTDAARRGEARIYEYCFDDRSVAMNLCLLRAGVLTVLKTTYDESIKLFSPASLLREEELQRFFAEGEIGRVEYYGRLMDWHAKLTDRKRSLHHLTVYRWGFLKRLAERRRAAAATLPAEAEAALAPSSTDTPVHAG